MFLGGAAGSSELVQGVGIAWSPRGKLLFPLLLGGRKHKRYSIAGISTGPVYLLCFFSARAWQC